MNKYIICFISLISTIALSQNNDSFEGIIIYENFFKSKIDSIKDSDFENAYGKQTKYMISKNGDYINLFKGSYITIQLFKNEQNKIYTALNGNDTIVYNKTNDKTYHEPISISKTDNEEICLDKLCNEIVFNTSGAKYKYYYNTDYFVDPKLYTDHYLGNWNQIINLTQSFPIKVILETDSFIMTSVAINIKEGSINQNLFNLPLDTPIKQAESNLFLK